MILTRWWKRNSEPTIQELKKIIDTQLLETDINTLYCQVQDHRGYLKEYLCNTSEGNMLMCDLCLNEFKKQTKQYNIQSLRDYKIETIKKLEQTYSQLQNIQEEDDKFSRILLTETTDTRSKIFDFFEDILKNGEQINKAIPTQFAKIQNKVKDEIHSTFSKIVQDKISILNENWTSQKYLEQLKQIHNTYKKEKAQFSKGKQDQFRFVLNQSVQKMISCVIALTKSKSKQETPKQNPQTQQWQQNTRLQDYIATQVEQIRLMRLDVDVLIKQNNNLTFDINQSNQNISIEKSKNNVLDSKLKIVEDEIKYKNQEIVQYLQKIEKLQNEQKEQMILLKRQLELQIIEKDKYYEMFVIKSDQVQEKKQQIEKMSEYINQLKAFYEGKRKNHKTQLVTTQNYQIKLQNQFLQLQVEYDQIAKQLEAALRTINLLEQLNQQLKSKILYQDDSSTLRKSVSSTQLNFDLKEKNRERAFGDLHSQFITKFQKFWISEEIQNYFKRQVQFRHLFTSDNSQQDSKTAIKYANQCPNYLVIAKTNNDVVFSWFTPKSKNQNQLFLNANKRKIFQWTRSESYNPIQLGLQGQDGFILQGHEIISQNHQLISRALDLKGEHHTVQLLKYEIHQVI